MFGQQANECFFFFSLLVLSSRVVLEETKRVLLAVVELVLCKQVLPDSSESVGGRCDIGHLAVYLADENITDGREHIGIFETLSLHKRYFYFVLGVVLFPK